MDALEFFAQHWDKKYPKISSSWRDHWPNLSTYFKYLQEIQRLIYRKVTKAKSVFLTDDSLLKILYLAMIDITQNGLGVVRIEASSTSS